MRFSDEDFLSDKAFSRFHISAGSFEAFSAKLLKEFVFKLDVLPDRKLCQTLSDQL